MFILVKLSQQIFEVIEFFQNKLASQIDVLMVLSVCINQCDLEQSLVW